MKELINKFILRNEANQEFLDNAGDFGDADSRIPHFNDFLVRSQYNTGLGLAYLRLLQQSNDEDIFSQFDFEDIAQLYSSLLKAQPFNLESYVEAAHYQYAVLDDAKNAREIAEEGIARANEKIEELQMLLHKMNKG